MWSSGQPARPADTALRGPSCGPELWRGSRAVVGGEAGHPDVVGVHPVVELLRPGGPGRHVAQVLDVDGGQHGGAGPVLGAVGRPHPGAPAAVQQQPGHPLIAEHRAAMVGQVAGERGGQLPGAADRDGPAALLAAERLRVGQHPGARLVHRLEHLERHPEQERLDVPAGELVLHHLHRGQLPPPGPDPAARVLVQPGLQRRAVPDRGELGLAEDVLDLVILVQQPEVGLRVGGREPGYLVRRPVPVQPHGQLPAVRESHLLHRVRLGVAQPVVRGQPELVMQQRRVDPDHRVPGGAGVDAETGQQQLLGGRPAAGHRPRVQDQAPVPRLGQVARGEQAVVPRPGHHDVGIAVGHAQPLPGPPANHCIPVILTPAGAAGQVPDLTPAG